MLQLLGKVGCGRNTAEFLGLNVVVPCHQRQAADARIRPPAGTRAAIQRCNAFGFTHRDRQDPLGGIHREIVLIFSDLDIRVPCQSGQQKVLWRYPGALSLILSVKIGQSAGLSQYLLDMEAVRIRRPP